jgi:hypothetical protein
MEEETPEEWMTWLWEQMEFTQQLKDLELNMEDD